MFHRQRSLWTFWLKNWTFKVNINKNFLILSSIYSELASWESEILVPNILFTLSNYRKQYFNEIKSEETTK